MKNTIKKNIPKKEEGNEIDQSWVDMISKNWGRYCSSCGVQKDMSKLKIFRKVGPATQIISECESCGLKTIITAIPNLGMQISQLRTDLTDTQELEKFSTPITTNDYLNFYNETKNINNVHDFINKLTK
jgi:hypothetical protein